MLIPIRTDNRLSLVPVVNYALVAVNVIAFIVQQRTPERQLLPFLLHPASPELVQFFTSMFMHGDWMHLLGNMVFLWVFGNSINDRFGHVGYAAFYLAGGVLSGIGYILLSGDAPVLGASGAISAVTGAYLVLFPRVRVTVLLLAFWIVPLEISSLVFLGLQFAWNLFASVTGRGGGIAYAAHSAGYVYGILIVALLLWIGLLPRDVFDLLSLWKSQRRRQSYRRMVSRGYDPFSHQQRREQRLEVEQTQSRPRLDTPAGQALEVRRQVSQAHGMGDFSTAASRYLELLNLEDAAVLPRQQQLDVANQLMTEQRHPQAADAYERLLKHYPGYEHRGDIELMLGLLYGRYLGQTEAAAQWLRRAVEDLHDGRKLQMAREELRSLESGGRG